MKNRDLVVEQKNQILMELNEVVKEGDPEKFAKVFTKLCENIQDSILDEVRETQRAADANVLAARGTRPLTSEERNYYNKVIEAMRSSNPKQALEELDVVMPTTVIDTVFEDLKQEHPLLDVIDFQNTHGLIEWLLNDDEGQLATWGDLTDEIVKELTSGFKKINTALYKLSAFIPVAKAMLDLGPEWLDRYVRTILRMSINNGLEQGIISGTGNSEPIGMIRQVGQGVTVTDGEYPEKDAIAVTDFSPASYGKLLAILAKNAKGQSRNIARDGVILVVNTVDYFTKVMPATTVKNVNGRYVNGVLPHPTNIIQSVNLPEGKAVLGLRRRYFMGIGTEKSGKVLESDHYRFLEDERVYLTKLYGNGLPKDNNSFVVLDISELEPAAVEVRVVD